MRAPWTLVLLAPLAAAGAAPPAVSTVETLSASAHLTYVSHDGCVQNELSVFVNQTTTRHAALPSRTTTDVSYSRSRFDFCEDVDLGTDLGSSRNAHFAADINRAQLEAAIDGADASHSIVRIGLALAWTGTGGVRQIARPAAASGAKAEVRTESQVRDARVEGRVDDQDVTGSSIGASLQLTRQTITR